MSRFAAKCSECEHEYEYEGSYKDVVPVCLNCSSPKTVRIIASAPGYSLKGMGWANEGYGVTNRGSDAQGDRASRQGKAVSFPGQKVR